MWAVKQFRPYIYGRKFTVVTDHKLLTWLFNVTDPGARLVRWRLKLEEYDYDIVYKPGTLNTNADALSRIATVNSMMPIQDHVASAYEIFCQNARTQVFLNPDVNEIEGDLFEATEDFALGHCVSADFKMSQGIALEFRKKFGQVDTLINLNKKVTEIASIKHNNRQIIYIINKQNFKEKPTLETMFMSITNLRQFCEEQNVTKLAIPRIGSGHDQLNWDQIRSMIRYIFKKSKIKIVIFVNTIYSEKEKMNIIKEFHETSLGGHQGVSRTIKRIKQHHTWKNLKSNVKEYIKSCISCQINKSSNHRIQQPMVVSTTATRPFEKIFLDIVGPVDTSLKGNSYILTIQDDLSKYSAAVPLPNHTANTIARAFVEHFVCLHGIPDSIVTDQGREFMSKIFQLVVNYLRLIKLIRQLIIRNLMEPSKDLIGLLRNT